MKRLLLFLGLIGAAYGQNAYPLVNPEVQYLDSNGAPLAGSKLCTYIANTSTPQATYTDSTGATANTNPIVLDSYGRASVWLGPALYKLVLLTGGDGTCSTGTVQWTQNNVGAVFSVGGSSGFVQYSAGGGLLAGDANFTWSKTGQTLTINGLGPTSIALTVANGYIAAGGLDAYVVGAPTTPLNYNAIQVPYGGFYGLSFTAQNYLNVGSYSGALASGPPLTSADSFSVSNLSYSTVGACFASPNSSGVWACLSTGGGGGGGAVGPNGAVQFSNGSGSFQGTGNLTADSSGNVTMAAILQITGAGGGVDVEADTAYNSIQTVGGYLATIGNAATVGFTVIGNSGQTADLLDIYTGGGSPTKRTFVSSTGALTAYGLTLSTITGSAQCLQVNSSGVVSGSGGTCGSGGGGAPGSPVNSVQVNVGGVFTGSANLTYASSILQITTASSSVYGLYVTPGYLYSDGGYVASSSCTSYQCIQTPAGGFYGESANFEQYAAFASVSSPTKTTGDNWSSGPGVMYYSASSGTQLWYFTYGTGTSTVSDAYLHAAGGSFTGSAFNSLNMLNGGVHTALGVTVDQALYPKATGTCSSLNAPASGYGGFGYNTSTTYCYWNGSAWASVNLAASGGGGVSSLNSLTGALSITNGGTSNEITVTSSGSTIALTLPQQIGTASSPTFSTVNATTHYSSATGTTLAFYDGCAQINGNGVVTLACSGSGVDVTADTAYNSIQTTGGFLACSSGTCSSSPLTMGSTTLINSGGAFVGNGVNVGTYGISAGNYNVAGGYVGQSYSLFFSGGFTLGSSTYHTMVFQGGILVSVF